MRMVKQDFEKDSENQRNACSSYDNGIDDDDNDNNDVDDDEDYDDDSRVVVDNIEGPVEVQVYKRWDTLSEDASGTESARVVYRVLGYDGYVKCRVVVVVVVVVVDDRGDDDDDDDNKGNEDGDEEVDDDDDDNDDDDDEISISFFSTAGKYLAHALGQARALSG